MVPLPKAKVSLRQSSLTGKPSALSHRIAAGIKRCKAKICSDWARFKKIDFSCRTAGRITQLAHVGGGRYAIQAAPNDKEARVRASRAPWTVLAFPVGAAE